MTARRFLILLAVFAAVLAGCGDDDGPATNEYSEALAQTLFPGAEREALGVGDDEVGCVAAEFVAAVGGPDALAEQGISPADLAEADNLASVGIAVDEADARQVADALEPCGIPVRDLLLSQLAGLDDATKSCVEERVDEDELRTYIVETIVEDDPASAETGGVVESILPCFQGG